MMETLKELEISKLYEGKTFIPQKLWKIAIGSGNSRAVVFSRRISKSQGALIGITDEIFNKWWDDDIYFSVYIDLIEPSNIIEACGVNKLKGAYITDGSFQPIKLSPTHQELEIFQNVMDYITSVIDIQ